MASDYTYIDTPAAFASFIRVVPEKFSFDTEFTYERTFRPIPELLQIGLPDRIGIIDLRADLPYDALKNWFQNHNTVRIVHSSLHDIAVMNEVFHTEIGRLEDTQLAYSFLNAGTSQSYAALIQRYFDVELDKTLQKSRWDRRPLSEAQLAYAALDIVHLTQLWEILEAELREAGRLDWYGEERDRTQRPTADDPSLVVGSATRITQLNDTAFHFLQSLDSWRTDEAELINIPKNWILSKGNMLRLAAVKRLSDLSMAKVLSSKQINRHRTRFKRMHQEAQSVSKSSDSIPLKRLRNTIRELGEECKVVARELCVSEELLCSQKDLLFAIRTYLRNGELPSWFGTWRRALIGDAVIAAAEAFVSRAAHR